MKIVNSDQVLGVQANFWSHINRDEAGMDRQIFPRLVALSETAWTDAHQKNWEYFMKKLALHYKSMELLDLYYMKE
jgi:hexosaminidase